MAHILIVDDEPDLRELLTQYLAGLGHSCDQAASGEEGVRRVAEREYDLIISDIKMPRMSGLEFLRTIQPSVEARTPCMIITALGDEVSHAVEAIRVGACNFLSKPFELNDIKQAVDRALSLRHAYRFRREYQAHLEQRLQEQERKLQETFEGTLIAMASMIEGKDERASPLAADGDSEIRETYDHLFRVRDYSMILARELGLDEQEIHDLQLGAILHDIGKYRIPDRILYKPGKLDEEEWEVMRQHPVYGAEFVRRITILAPAEAVVLHHHERWDGNGYPHGTTGEEIPLGARIFSVVDAFDAMCERRCYKEARSPDLALAELKRCAGTQFDPRVVEAFENAWPRILKVQDVGNRPAAPRSLWVDRPRPTTPEMLEAEVRRASGM